MRAEWADILRSTPMRMTLRLVALFTLISLLTFAATWWLANRALLDATEAGLDAKQARLRAKQVFHWIYHRGAADFDARTVICSFIR